MPRNTMKDNVSIETRFTMILLIVILIGILTGCATPTYGGSWNPAGTIPQCPPTSTVNCSFGVTITVSGCRPIREVEEAICYCAQTINRIKSECR